MKIRSTKGPKWWSAENNCWNINEIAATEYKKFDDCPVEIIDDDGTTLTLDLTLEGYFADNDPESDFAAILVNI